jgi:hypothetical protein
MKAGSGHSFICFRNFDKTEIIDNKKCQIEIGLPDISWQKS